MGALGPALNAAMASIGVPPDGGKFANALATAVEPYVAVQIAAAIAPLAAQIAAAGAMAAAAKAAAGAASAAAASAGAAAAGAAATANAARTSSVTRPATPTTTAATPVTPVVVSEPLIDGGTRTALGTTANAFVGYVSPDGGGFGVGNTGNISQMLRGLEAMSGIDSGTTYINGVYAGGNPTVFGMSANATATEIASVSNTNSRIANGDQAAIKAALTSSNSWLRANAQRQVSNHPEWNL